VNHSVEYEFEHRTKVQEANVERTKREFSRESWVFYSEVVMVGSKKQTNASRFGLSPSSDQYFSMPVITLMGT
jgi:hypothetical protein